MSWGLADLPPHQTFINNAVLSSKETRFSWLVPLLPGMNSSVSMVFLPILILPCSMWDSLAGKVCWLHGATDKSKQSSLQWLERWIPPRSLFLLPTPSPCFLVFLVPVHLPLPTNSRFSEATQSQVSCPMLSNVTQTLPDHAFWFLVPTMWSPWMTSLSDP